MDDKKKMTILAVVIIIALVYFVKNLFFYDPAAQKPDSAKYDNFGLPQDAPAAVYEDIRRTTLTQIQGAISSGKVDNKLIEKLKYIEEEKLAGKYSEWKKLELDMLKAEASSGRKFSEVPDNAPMETYEKLRQETIRSIEEQMRGGKTAEPRMIEKLKYLEDEKMEGKSSFWVTYQNRNNERLSKKSERSKSKKSTKSLTANSPNSLTSKDITTVEHSSEEEDIEEANTNSSSSPEMVEVVAHDINIDICTLDPITQNYVQKSVSMYDWTEYREFSYLGECTQRLRP